MITMQELQKPLSIPPRIEHEADPSFCVPEGFCFRYLDPPKAYIKVSNTSTPQTVAVDPEGINNMFDFFHMLFLVASVCLESQTTWWTVLLQSQRH